MTEGRRGALFELARLAGEGTFSLADLSAFVDLLKESDPQACRDALCALLAIQADRMYLLGMSRSGREGGPVLVWRFDEAPHVFRDMSERGGDWLALVPAGAPAEWIDWKYYEVSHHELPDGRTVLVGVRA